MPPACPTAGVVVCQNRAALRDSVHLQLFRVGIPSLTTTTMPVPDDAEDEVEDMSYRDRLSRAQELQAGAGRAAAQGELAAAAADLKELRTSVTR